MGRKNGQNFSRVMYDTYDHDRKIVNLLISRKILDVTCYHPTPTISLDAFAGLQLFDSIFGSRDQPKTRKMVNGDPLVQSSIAIKWRLVEEC